MSSKTRRRSAASSEQDGLTVKRLGPAPVGHSVPLSFDVLQERPSLLSWGSEQIANFQGLLHLFVIVLVILSAQHAIDNILTYRESFDYRSMLTLDVKKWPFLWAIATLVGLNVFSLLAFCYELVILKYPVLEKIVLGVMVVNILSCFIVPALIMIFVKPYPMATIILLLFCINQTMKLTSYHHVNFVLRKEYLHKKALGNLLGRQLEKSSKLSEKRIEYPENMSLGHLYYFLSIPTFCYHLVYPRSGPIRVLWLLRQLIQIVVVVSLIFMVADTMIQPNLISSYVELTQGHLFPWIGQTLKLGVYNLLVWLLGFYLIFHLYTNVTAEVLRFGDREFYRDWWNARDMDYFWKTWNVPINQWFNRHVFAPLLNKGLNIYVVYGVCFLISAIVQEAILSIAFQNFNMWFFLAILFQIPLIQVTRWINRKTSIGNVVFWIIMMLSAPFVTVLYYKNYLSRGHH